jgi:anti-anti-sigma factor
MDLILEVRTGHQRVTMACHGKLIAGKEADAFRRSALLLMGGFDKITINLAGVRSADCVGLDSLASVLAQAMDKGKQVRLTHAGPWMIPLLQAAGLAHFMEPFGAPAPPQAASCHPAVA